MVRLINCVVQKKIENISKPKALSAEPNEKQQQQQPKIKR